MKNIFIIWLAFFSLTLSSTASAAQDVRLLIDLSGSMKQNDPLALRSESLRLFIDQLQTGDQAGVWTFANQVNMLVPYGSVDSSWKSLARDRISDVNSLGQWTNIGKALEIASVDMSAPEKGTVFILISDGKVDISNDDQQNQRERQRILNELIPDIKSRGGSVHSIALTDSFDAGVLARLAKETQGSFYQATDLNGLEEHFLNIISSLKDDGEVPIISNRFFVDKTTRSFKATLFKDSPSTTIVLKSPDGQVYQSHIDYAWLDWTSTSIYDEIVVTQPRGGSWEIVGNITSESQVTLDSDLAIQSSMSEQIVFPGESVAMEMTITSYGNPVLEPAYLNLLEVSSEIFDENQKPRSVKTIRIDGRYQIEIDPFLAKPGSYQVTTRFSGPDFVRQVTGTIRVLEHLAIDTVKQEDAYLLRVTPINPDISKENTQLQAVLHYPDASTKVIELNWQNDGYWQTSVTSEDQGIHLVKLSARIQLNNKTTPIKLATQNLQFPLPAQIKKAAAAAELLAREKQAKEAMAAESMDSDVMDANGLADPVVMENETNVEASQGLKDAIDNLLEGIDADTMKNGSMVDSNDMSNQMDASDATDVLDEPRAFVKYPIELVEVMDPGLIIVVPDADEQLGEDPWVGEIPEEITVETGPSLFELFLWSLPALAIIGGFYLFFFKFMRHQRDLSQERNELEDMIRIEEEKAEEAAKAEEQDDEDPTENFVPYDEAAIESANDIDVDDLGKDTEHLFDEDIVSMPDMTPQADLDTPPELKDEVEGDDEDEDDVFDLGDLSDLGDDVDDVVDEDEHKDEIK